MVKKYPSIQEKKEKKANNIRQRYLEFKNIQLFFKNEHRYLKTNATEKADIRQKHDFA